MCLNIKKLFFMRGYDQAIYNKQKKIYVITQIVLVYPPHLHLFKKWLISNIYFDVIKCGQKI